MLTLTTLLLKDQTNELIPFQTSVYELVGSPYFRSMAIVPEDFIKKYGAKFNCEYLNYIISTSLSIVFKQNI